MKLSVLATRRRHYRIAVISVAPEFYSWERKEFAIQAGEGLGYRALVGRTDQRMCDWGRTPQAAVRSAIEEWVKRWGTA